MTFDFANKLILVVGVDRKKVIKVIEGNWLHLVTRLFSSVLKSNVR